MPNDMEIYTAEFLCAYVVNREVFSLPLLDYRNIKGHAIQASNKLGMILGLPSHVGVKERIVESAAKAAYAQLQRLREIMGGEE